MTDLLTLRDEGLYCEAGGFYIDPWKPVERAVITHAHSDHARAGSGSYLAHRAASGILRHRLGNNISLQGVEYGAEIAARDVRVSLHPAGHVLGSAQVRVEHKGEVWCVSGDYKLHLDPTCTPFQSVRCNVFVTEATFGLPIYRWPTNEAVFEEINAWWRSNAAENRPSILYAYAFGKAQRILAGVDASIGPVIVHGAVDVINAYYRSEGVHLPNALHANDPSVTLDQIQRALVLAPPLAKGTPWLKRFKNASDGFASGWMRVRGNRRRKSVDRGFVLSDHADFDELNRAIRESGAERVLATHGTSDALVR